MEIRIENKFAQLQVESEPRESLGHPENMDGLVHDLHSALEESTLGGPEDLMDLTLANLEKKSKELVNGGQSRRRTWRRRCKSTSNLTQIGSSSQTSKGLPSEDSTSTEDEEDEQQQQQQQEQQQHLPSTSNTGRVIKERGILGQQQTDSDEMGPPRSSLVIRPRDQVIRKKRSTDPLPSSNSTFLANKGNLPLESDSVNDNVSTLRPNTKRKRKFKRMALDPNPVEVQLSASKATPVSNPRADGVLIKRPKVKSDLPGSMITAKSKISAFRSPNSMNGPFAVGKRKRGNREKSLEPDHLSAKSFEPIDTQASTSVYRSPDIRLESMDCDDDNLEDEDKRSSSSLSSSEWEDDVQTDCGDTGREADDEQSDWPGSETSFMRARRARVGLQGLINLTDQEEEDDDDEDEDALNSSLDAFFYMKEGIDGQMPLTQTARQTYMARMKRLAECVPGREIRAGTRKVRGRQSGFTIKSSSSEQLSRFLQDSNRSELKLSLFRVSDRNKVIQMANLYSLSVRLDGENVIILSKTGKTVRLKEFPVPLAPPMESTDYKRRRCTPPNSPLLEGSSTSNEPTLSPLQSDVVMNTLSSVPQSTPPCTPSKSRVTTQQRSKSPTLGVSKSRKVKEKFLGSVSN
ncbi:uncharacterized protein LOC131886583 [Tigriopus californicus]|uniref:uncharacterized protein LOC131886583 n=1 Tax=Tigriopus californicus TaxID=6832 RepID=UPI0027DA8C1B|nr:uncharacterized protein LOC131886583 [Tigriopus californicus]